MSPRTWAICLAFTLVACTPSQRTTPLHEISETKGYRYTVIEQSTPKQVSDAFIVATFSGGGTRAAALATGALRALSETKLRKSGADLILADEIDMISSVSGGSVTAAYFALHGRTGLNDFTNNFLKENVQGHLIATAFNPVTWFRLATPSYARIDVLRNYFDTNLFKGATYGSLLARSDAPGRRPYIVLNAADMTTGAVFSFTQDQFDLICSDLSRLLLADAVAASAAYPVALTALTLKNHSPCDAQANAARDSRTRWTLDKNTEDKVPRPRPAIVADDLESGTANPPAFRRGRIAVSYLNEDGRMQFIHLLDGGIADNLGLSEPLDLLTNASRSPSIRNRIELKLIRSLAFIVVNARSEPDTTYAQQDTPPGTLSTLLTTIGTPIDSTSFQLLGNLDAMVGDPENEHIRTFRILVDFDFIDDSRCRRMFKSIDTTWALSDGEVDALIKLGDAMVRQSEEFKELVSALNGQIDPTAPTIAQACAQLEAAKR